MNDVTAVFVSNDELAMGVISGLCDHGRRVPEDVSVIGFDDHPLAKVCRPPLTTIHQHFEEAGGRAVDMLLHLVECADANRSIEPQAMSDNLPGRLIVRSSTCAPAARCDALGTAGLF